MPHKHFFGLQKQHDQTIANLEAALVEATRAAQEHEAERQLARDEATRFQTCLQDTDAALKELQRTVDAEQVSWAEKLQAAETEAATARAELHRLSAVEARCAVLEAQLAMPCLSKAADAATLDDGAELQEVASCLVDLMTFFQRSLLLHVFSCRKVHRRKIISVKMSAGPVCS